MSLETVTGDRWSMTRGRCEEWLQTLEPESVDALITDPPYGSGGRTTTARRTTAGKANDKYLNGDRDYPDFDGETRDQMGWVDWMTWVLMLAMPAMKPGAVFAIFVDWRQIPALWQVVQRSGLIVRGMIDWDKTPGCRPQRKYPSQQVEYILWGTNGATRPDRICGTTSGSMNGVFRHKVKSDDKEHAVGKPTPLMADVVPICHRGGHIIDPFAGSGTTGKAALLNRYGYTFAGCESTAANFNVAVRRIRDAAAAFTADSGQQLSLESARATV